MAAETPTPVSRVQAMVGCPHRWEQQYEYEILGGHGSRATHRKCTRCKERTERYTEAPAPAPDCSTLWGALKAADTLVRGGHWFEVHSYGSVLFRKPGTHRDSAGSMYANDEHEAATAICTLILEALDNNKTKEM